MHSGVVGGCLTHVWAPLWQVLGEGGWECRDSALSLGPAPMGGKPRAVHTHMHALGAVWGQGLQFWGCWGWGRAKTKP